MKKLFQFIFLLFLLVIIAWPIYYFTSKLEKDDSNLRYGIAENRDIKNYVISSGIVVPKEEVEIKSRVSGILGKLYVSNGQEVKKGDIIGSIEVIPNMSSMNAIQSNIKILKLKLKEAELNLERNQALYEKGIIAKNALERVDFAHKDAIENLKQAKQEYEIIKTGNIQGSGITNTNIVATIDGYITGLPTKVGSSVIESNNFNPGTTIAKIADIKDLVFEGEIKEFEVSEVALGMEVEITASITKELLKGKLIEVGTSGIDKEGLIRFEIKCSVDNFSLLHTRFSANAKLIKEFKKDVLCVRENWLLQEDDKWFATLQPNEEKRQVKLGSSDGFYVEILDGLKANDTLIYGYDN